MPLYIADSFQDSLTRLSAAEQKAVKLAVFDLQQNPDNPGLHMHRVERCPDRNFWSARVGRDIRLILHRKGGSLLVCHAAHHNPAYLWARRRKIETHPTTGAAQTVVLLEQDRESRVAQSAATPPSDEAVKQEVEYSRPSRPLSLTPVPVGYGAPTPAAPPPFALLSHEQLLGVGVPSPYLEEVRWASEDAFTEFMLDLPQEAAEALLEYLDTKTLPAPAIKPAPDTTPLSHPDAARRFYEVESADALERALAAPWEKWLVFLHPSQRALVERDFAGPARVIGSAGTGKSIVALHRAARFLKESPETRPLLVTFSAPLAARMKRGLALLADKASLLSRMTVLSFKDAARYLYAQAFGAQPRVASDDALRKVLEDAVRLNDAKEISMTLLLCEWREVVDRWQIASLEGYHDAPRLGRGRFGGEKMRARLWPVLERARSLLEERSLLSWPTVCARVAQHFSSGAQTPYTHVIADEAQDLSVQELRMLSAMAPSSSNGLFFAGDLGQRIFQEPFSWRAAGVDVAARTHVLKVNYRASRQLRKETDRLLPPLLRDVDGEEHDRKNASSLFNGPLPQIRVVPTVDEEIKAVSAWVAACMQDGVAPEELGIFVRTRHLLERARAVVKDSGLEVLELSQHVRKVRGAVAIGTMHLAKGLEFRAVAVMACDDDVLPLPERMESAVGEAGLGEAYEIERHLFYVACTRARERLFVSATAPGSDFLADFMAKA